MTLARAEIPLRKRTDWKLDFEPCPSGLHVHLCVHITHYTRDTCTARACVTSLPQKVKHLCMQIASPSMRNHVYHIIAFDGCRGTSLWRILGRTRLRGGSAGSWRKLLRPRRVALSHVARRSTRRSPSSCRGQIYTITYVISSVRFDKQNGDVNHIRRDARKQRSGCNISATKSVQLKLGLVKQNK